MKSRMSKNPMKSRMPKNPRMSRNPRNPRWVKQGGKSGSRYPGIPVSSGFHRILRILWIRDVSSGSPPYSGSENPFWILISGIRWGSERYIRNPEDTMGIQKIQRVRWRSRGSKGYGILWESRESLENPGNPMGIQGIHWKSWESRENLGNPGNTKSAVFHILTRFTLWN